MEWDQNLGQEREVERLEGGKTLGWEEAQIVLIFGVWQIVAELSAKCQP